MNVLSLFNGMSTGHLALKNIGVKVDKYYSSEIKKHAIELTQYHDTKTIQLGNILNWKEWDIDYSKIDLILSGSPCKDLSIAGKRKGLKGDNSGLFYVFLEILEHTRKFNKDVIFFQENVGSADVQEVNKISSCLGVQPVRINSNLLTAQNRDRYYWSNGKTKKIGLFGELQTDISQPKDAKIFLKDILTSGYTDRKKGRTMLESESRQNTDLDKLHKRYKEIGMINIVFEINNVRSLNKIELCRLQGFPDNYCDILTRNKAASLLGDGWTLPIIEHIFREIFNENVNNIAVGTLEEYDKNYMKGEK